MKKAATVILIMVISVFIYGQDKSNSEINTFLDSWHKAASNSDLEGYFEKIDDHGIYIGTDSSECWTRQAFYDWSVPYFQEKRGWSFEAISRNIYFSEDGSMAWFDEMLTYRKGTLRGSGVLIKRETEWRILHYVLSVPVPNDKYKEVMNLIQSKTIILEEEE